MKRQIETNHRIKASIILIVVLSFLIGCENKEDIIVGFSGCLTGRLSSLGIAGRNGVLLAIDQINKAQGINGHKVKLIIKDDQHDPKTALKVDQELIESGAIAVIGHMTSSMSLIVTPLFNKEHRVLLSPTSTTNDLTGKDDFFLRTALPDIGQTNHLANFVITELNIKRMIGIFDRTNQSFTEGWIQNFATAYRKSGGKLRTIISFASTDKTDYLTLSKRLLKDNPGAVAIVAGPLETALLSQHLKRLSPGLQLLSSGWAKTADLIENGGPAVEGIILPQSHNSNSKQPEFLEFKKQYTEFYGKPPNFAATGSYDATRMLFQALKKTTNPSLLKNTILNIRNFKGVQGNIRLDTYGDAIRKTFLVTVRNGQFLTLE